MTRTAPVLASISGRAADNFPAQRASAGTAAGCEGELVANVHFIWQAGDGQRGLISWCNGAGDRFCWRCDCVPFCIVASDAPNCRG